MESQTAATDTPTAPEQVNKVPFQWGAETLCCGVLYQTVGARRCLWYSLGRVFFGVYDAEKDKTIPYYLDVWATMVLGLVVVVTMTVLILQRA